MVSASCRQQKRRCWSSIPAMVLFPTPPFADETAITFFTSLMLLFWGNPRCIRGICGGAPERGRPCARRQPLRLTVLSHQHTRGFSCCKQRNVEKSRGFNMTLRCNTSCGVVGGGDATRNGETKHRHLRLFCGAQTELSLRRRMRQRYLAQRRHHEEVQD
jgi:hypothetical protein